MDILQLAELGTIPLFIAYLAYRDRMFNKTIRNHFKHTEDAYNRTLDVVDSNTRIQERCKHTK